MKLSRRKFGTLLGCVTPLALVAAALSVHKSKAAVQTISADEDELRYMYRIDKYGNVDRVRMMQLKINDIIMVTEPNGDLLGKGLVKVVSRPYVNTSGKPGVIIAPFEGWC